MTYDEFLAPLLASLTAINARLAKIEDAILGEHVPGPPPAPTGGLYQFVRPLPVEPRYGLGVRMTEPDVAEAIKRACYCVRWSGDVAKTGQAEDEAWMEIERLKTDPVLQSKYRLVDPEFAGFALLTNLLEPSHYDGFTGGMVRDAYQGYTVERFINLQFGIDSTPSGE